MLILQNKITHLWSNSINNNNPSCHLLSIAQAVSISLILHLIDCPADIVGPRWRPCFNVQQGVEPRWPDCGVPLHWLLWGLPGREWWTVFKTIIRSLITNKSVFLNANINACVTIPQDVLWKMCHRLFWWREILHRLIAFESSGQLPTSGGAA